MFIAICLADSKLILSCLVLPYHTQPYPKLSYHTPPHSNPFHPTLPHIPYILYPTSILPYPCALIIFTSLLFPTLPYPQPYPTLPLPTLPTILPKSTLPYYPTLLPYPTTLPYPSTLLPYLTLPYEGVKYAKKKRRSPKHIH